MVSLPLLHPGAFQHGILKEHSMTGCLLFGPPGTGKTLDLLTPALLQAPGAALVTLTKPDDLLLTISARRAVGPVVVLDPFGAAPGLPELIWDPIAGCVDATVAERRASRPRAVSCGRSSAAAIAVSGTTKTAGLRGQPHPRRLQLARRFVQA